MARDNDARLLRDLCNSLYEECLCEPEKMYTQEDLLTLNLVPGDDKNILAECISSLCKQRRFISYLTHDHGVQSWKVVKKEDTARYKGLSQEESVVLSYIDDSQREGIWVRYIRTRSNLAQNTVNNALKKLEQKGIVKQITNAKNPARKHYMLAHLQPSEDVTGGPFFTDGALDEDYVYQLSEVVHGFVARQSWDLTSSNATTSYPFSYPDDKSKQCFLPMAPGYTNYPSLSDITAYVNEKKVSQIGLIESDIKQLMDILCWDGRIVKVSGGTQYRSVKGYTRSFNVDCDANGFMESPCGNCTVFDWCESQGAINSKTCLYFTEWLDE